MSFYRIRLLCVYFKNKVKCLLLAIAFQTENVTQLSKNLAPPKLPIYGFHNPVKTDLKISNWLKIPPIEYSRNFFNNLRFCKKMDDRLEKMYKMPSKYLFLYSLSLINLVCKLYYAKMQLICQSKSRQ